MGGEFIADLAQDQVLGFAVHLGHQVFGVLEIHLVLLAKTFFEEHTCPAGEGFDHGKGGLHGVLRPFAEKISVLPAHFRGELIEENLHGLVAVLGNSPCGGGEEAILHLA